MNRNQVKEILKATDFVHRSGTKEERKVAELLREKSARLGADARIEAFEVRMSKVSSASLTADGKEIPCKGYLLCGSGSVEAPFLYLPNTDPASLAEVNGKIVLLDTGIGYFMYKDLLENGVKGIITYDGSVNFKDRDIDEKELRPYVSEGKKTLAVNINAKDAFQLVKQAPETVKISVKQRESAGESQNVIAEIPGTSDEWIVLSAHYDTTSLSHGAYDNMTGCIGLLTIMEALQKGAPHRYGLRFVFCGSEERGLLGSKAYVAAHEEELSKIALNINLDMIGTVMGRFISVATAEEALVSYIRYFASIRGFGMAARQGVYSSDSTPFADKGIPAVSFARMAGPSQAHIHSRYDTMALLSEAQILKDGAFIAEFTREMADAAKLPVKREIPDNVKTQLDEYLNRKRKDA